jgi:hypothetical protein
MAKTATEVLTKIVVDCSTGISEIIPLTADEIAQREADRVAYEAQKAAEATAAAEKAAAREAILERLGLTADEAAILLG